MRRLLVHFPQGFLVQWDLFVKVEPPGDLSPLLFRGLQQLRRDGLLPDVFHGLFLILEEYLFVEELC